MATYVKTAQFIDICLEQGLDPAAVKSELKKLDPNYTVNITQIAARIANYKRRGLLPLESGNGVGVGEILKGTSTLYGPNNEIKQQWVKTDVPKQQSLDAFTKAMETLVKRVTPVIPKIDNTVTDNDLLTIYPIGDAHIGMLAWHLESGQDNDLGIATRRHIAALTKAVEKADPSEEAFIIDVGDFFHADNANNRTERGGNALDVDGRYAKVLQAGLQLAADMIEIALTKHKVVHWRSAIGNHNNHSAIMINYYLQAYFKNEPRVIIHESPAMYYYHKFGKNLIGITHGHTCKPDKLGELMAVDCEKSWSTTKYRYWYLGHVHHQSVKEYPSCTVETFRTLSGKDAWHSEMGYRSGQDLKVITLHKYYGEVERNTISLAML